MKKKTLYVILGSLFRICLLTIGINIYISIWNSDRPLRNKITLTAIATIIFIIGKVGVDVASKNEKKREATSKSFHERLNEKLEDEKNEKDRKSKRANESAI